METKVFLISNSLRMLLFSDVNVPYLLRERLAREHIAIPMQEPEKDSEKDFEE
jgi:hypothetical protein